MSKPKKPAVIAKTAAKKRGRPVGSKNKPKHLGDLPVGTTLTADQLFDRIKNMQPISSENWVPPPVDWEKLAKQLQEALAAEMKENEALEKILEEFKSVMRLDTSFTFWDRLVFLFSGKL